MAKDLKHRVPAFRQGKPLKAGLRLGVALLVVLILIATAVAIFRHGSQTQAAVPAAEAAAEPAGPPAPQFGFFQLMPDDERKIAEGDINAALRDKRLGKPPVESPCYLQVGAFPQLGEAEALKARLEGIGSLAPRLEQIRLEFATWYRVMLGPYRTILDANQVRLFLRSRAIDSVMQAPVR